MASRREIEQRKAALRAQLRKECLSGALPGGSLLPPVRELAEQNQLSSIVVRQVLKALEEEGLLYTVARVGTFVGHQPVASSEFYLLLLPVTHTIEGRFLQVKVGFEERIAQLGGATLLMTPNGAHRYRQNRQLPPLAGVFDFDEAPFGVRRDTAPFDVAHVMFAGSKRSSTSADLVSFHDVDGGRRAAQHLLSLGHRRIAFLGLHRAHGDPGIFAWSAEREEGWRQALQAEDIATEGLAYHVEEYPLSDQIQSAYKAAGSLVRRPDITAVVTANDLTAQGLIHALGDAKTPLGHWPAIVGFDDDPCVAGQNLSSYRLPWDEVGRTAAELLWQRRHGQLTDPPVHRQVPMRFIRRFSCQPNWSMTDTQVALVAARTSSPDGLACD